MEAVVANAPSLHLRVCMDCTDQSRARRRIALRFAAEYPPGRRRPCFAFREMELFCIARPGLMLASFACLRNA